MMHPSSHNFHQGLSLVEFLIYFTILAGISVVLVNLLFTSVRGQGAVESRSEVQQNIRYSFTRITQAIYAATGVNGVPGATLSLAMADGAKNPTVFDVSGNILRITEGVSAAQTLTSNKVEITNLTFTKIANPAPAKNSIQINLTIRYKDNGNPQYKFSKNDIVTATLKQ